MTGTFTNPTTASTALVREKTAEIQAMLAALGVKRVSVGGALARAAFGAFLRAATEMARDGTFTFTQVAVPGRDLNRWFSAPDNSPVRFEQ